MAVTQSAERHPTAAATATSAKAFARKAERKPRGVFAKSLEDSEEGGDTTPR
jgi:hypothetical protein